MNPTDATERRVLDLEAELAATRQERDDWRRLHDESETAAQGLRAELEKVREERDAAVNGMKYWEGVRNDNAALRSQLAAADRELDQAWAALFRAGALAALGGTMGEIVKVVDEVLGGNKHRAGGARDE